MKIQVNNITLHYTQMGVGKPLILLHGNGEDHTIFDALTAKLQQHFTVYAIDSRNHGESSKTSNFGYEAMTQDIRQFIEKLGLKNVSILGFSDGAIIATMLEMSHPSTFKKMMLLGINLKPSDFTPENMEYLKSEYATTKDPLLKLMLEQPNIELERLKEIHTPTLIVRAEDELFNDSLYEQIMNTLPNAQLLVMEGHDHASYIADSDILFDDAMKFLSGK